MLSLLVPEGEQDLRLQKSLILGAWLNKFMIFKNHMMELYPKTLMRTSETHKLIPFSEMAPFIQVFQNEYPSYEIRDEMKKRNLNGIHCIQCHSQMSIWLKSILILAGLAATVIVVG